MHFYIGLREKSTNKATVGSAPHDGDMYLPDDYIQQIASDVKKH